MRIPKEDKVKLLIKAYLSLNRNRKVRTKEIADWITNNNFGLNNTAVKAQLITLLVKECSNTKDNLLGDVHIEKMKGVNHIWLE